MAPSCKIFLQLLLFANLMITAIYIVHSSPTFTLVNSCGHTVWPAISPAAGVAPLSTSGFALQKGQSNAINVPSSWAGRLWGRTHCTEDSAGKLSCLTGDVGSGGGANSAATLAEFTLDGHGGFDSFSVSLIAGYNLPMLVEPQGGSGPHCSSTGCVRDLNGACPSELKVNTAEGVGVACKSACEAFACRDSWYAPPFKHACPRAPTGPYDYETSTLTCVDVSNYLITFCPSPTERQSHDRMLKSTDYYRKYNGSISAPSGGY